MPVKILVADDDKAMLNLYSRIFANTAYTIVTVETFTEAFGLLRAKEFDLLITDFMFPDGLGTELIRIFNEGKQNARSLLVTGTPYARETLAYEGVKGYIEKPFKVDQFIAAVNKALA